MHPSCNRAGRRGCGSPVSLGPWTRRNCSDATPNIWAEPINPFPMFLYTPHTDTQNTLPITHFLNKAMTDLKDTVISLLVGSEKSKSHPGTQAKLQSIAQGPGCPSYSGGGKDPLKAISDKLTTPASPLDLTSLAAAIPEPATENSSAWTLVAPKPKRKRKRRTDGHDETEQDKQTDLLTDKIGNQGGKRKDSDRPTADAGRLVGRSGGSEGQHPLVDTATPGCSAEGRELGWRPGTDRDPRASGESSSTTTSAGQTAKDRVNNGGHTDPNGNPIRTRGATASGEINTARPPTTTTDKLKTNAPNLPSTRAHSRSRKRNRKTGDKRNNPVEIEPSSHSNKRNRLDDTISPRGEHKRARTEYRQPRDAVGSYAKAAQSHLSVAVTTTPRTDLTQAEANNIQGQIQKAIFAACIEPLAPGQTRYAPAFEGKAFLSEGVLKMWCHDDQSLNWLNNILPSLKSPRSGTELAVVRQAEVPIKIKSGLYVPDYDGTIGQLHQVLSSQNPWYGVPQWTLFSYQVSTTDPPGMFLTLGIPKEEIPKILAHGRKVAYSTGTIYVRFFTEEGLSEVPPGLHPAPEVRGGPDVAAGMEVDGPTDQSPKTPEPSVSTVLDNIEAVLLEPNTNDNININNAPAESIPARRERQ